MRAVIVGAGMGGLMTALALRQSGVFASVDIYEQTKVPSTAGAGLNVPPNGARICRWLGVDLDGGDPKGPDGAIDGGRAAILDSTRQFNADGTVTKRPFDHATAKGDRAGATTYWVRGGELLNVWIARYEPDSAAFEQEEGDWFPVSREEILREVGEAFTGHPSRDDLLALAGAVVRPTKWGLYDRDALETWVQGRICLLGDAAHPMLPTFGQGAAQSFEDAAALASAFALHKRDVATALLHYERVRHYRATRFQLGSKFAFDHLRARDTAEQKALLETLDERVSPAFAHDKRGGEDDSSIYAYDARKIGTELPPKRLGPWDVRRAARADYAAITRKLWTPATPGKAPRPVTRAEVARHNSRDDCWIIVSGKVYDITEWAPHHPGGAGIARMYAGKEATAEFGDYHSAEAVAHMAHFCIGDLVEAPSTVAAEN